MTDTGGHIEVVRSATRDRARELTRGGRTAVVCSKDRDEACELVAPYFTAHDLDVVGRPADLDVLLRARSTASITIADLRYGTEVVLRPGLPYAGFNPLDVSRSNFLAQQRLAIKKKWGGL